MPYMPDLSNKNDSELRALRIKCLLRRHEDWLYKTIYEETTLCLKMRQIVKLMNQTDSNV